MEEEDRKRERGNRGEGGRIGGQIGHSNGREKREEEEDGMEGKRWWKVSKE